MEEGRLRGGVGDKWLRGREVGCTLDETVQVRLGGLFRLCSKAGEEVGVVRGGGIESGGCRGGQRLAVGIDALELYNAVQLKGPAVLTKVAPRDELHFALKPLHFKGRHNAPASSVASVD